jgi:hypothetical protein
MAMMHKQTFATIPHRIYGTGVISKFDVKSSGSPGRKWALVGLPDRARVRC